MHFNRAFYNRRLCYFMHFNRRGFHMLHGNGRCAFGSSSLGAELLAKLVRQTVFHCVGMRCHRHAHVLQFPNDFGIVGIQFTG